MPEVWDELFAEPLGMSEGDRYVTVRALAQNTLPVRLQSEQMAMTHPLWSRDLAVLNQLEVEGDDQLGYRIEDNTNRRQLVWYAVPTENGLRLREAGTENVELGLDALQLLAADRVPAARRRLEWAAQGTNASLFNPFGQTPFVQLWFLIRDRDDKRLLELAAATLAARTAETLDNRVLQVLSQPIDGLLEAQRIQVLRARLQALRSSKQFESYLAVAEQLSEKYSIVPSVTFARADALLSLERFEQADQLIQEQLKQHDGESSLRFCRLISAVAQADRDAVKFSREVRDRFDRDGYLLGLSALLELEAGDTQAAFNLSQKSLPLMIFREPRVLRLVALCEAANGQPAQSLERLRTLHRTEGPSKDPRWDQLVMGRIAEHYGLRDIAAESYRAATQIDRGEGLALTLYPRLAQQWLDRVTAAQAEN